MSDRSMGQSPRRVELIPAQRRAIILDHLRRDGAASIQELSERTGASGSTVRRDLEQLVEEGYLERTHGGASLIQSNRATFERAPAINAHLQAVQKRAIGLEAAKRLGPRDSVILEASSTVVQAAIAAATFDIQLTVVTNSLDIALIGADQPGWKLLMPGGTLRQGSRMLAGEPAQEFLRSVHADLCLFGAYAVTGRVLTDATLEVASLKRAMLGAARRKILLVDSSKFKPPAFSTFCELSEIDEVITDDGIGREQRAALEALVPAVTVVAVEA
jgi:DeoR/GlpR family transcriptional regulator of sugar metabolism